MAEHDLLRQHHVRDERGFALSHRAARHRHNGQLVDKPVVASLEVAQPVQGDLLSPTVEEQPADRNDAPPREMPEDDLQVDEQLADLHIQIADVETQNKIEVIRKEAHDDAGTVQVKHPQNYPTHPNRSMLCQVFAVGKYSALYRLIRPFCDCFENTQRNGIAVMVCIPVPVHTPKYEPKHEYAGQQNGNDLCHDKHHIADRRPITCEVLAVYEQGKEVPRRGGKAFQVGRQQYLPLQHVRILRDGGRKGIVYADKFTEVIGNGQPEISARLTKAHIRLPERRAQCQESKRDDDGNGNIKTFAHNTPPQFPHRKAIGYKCSTSSRRQVPMLSREELRGSS